MEQSSSHVQAMKNLIDGKRHSQDLHQELKAEISKLSAASKGQTPHLAVVLASDDPASAIYVKNKENACAKIGIQSSTHRLPMETTQAQLEKVINDLNEQPNIDGILLQLPLYKHLDSCSALNKISYLKDVDGLTYVSQGLMNWKKAGHRPCTPAGIIHVLKKENIVLNGANAVVIGRSVLVGASVATLLQHEGATVTQMHSQTRNKEEIARSADILIAAAGKPRLIGRDWIKPGAVVIDVGIHRLPSGKITGDVDFEAVQDLCSKITPVPGGVGPMTIALLLKNTVESFRRRLAL